MRKFLLAVGMVMALPTFAMAQDAANGESVFLEGNSPVQGEKEYVWLVAALKPKGLFRMLMISPASDYSSLSGIYEDVVRSVELE